MLVCERDDEKSSMSDTRGKRYKRSIPWPHTAIPWSPGRDDVIYKNRITQLPYKRKGPANVNARRASGRVGAWVGQDRELADPGRTGPGKVGPCDSLT